MKNLIKLTIVVLAILTGSSHSSAQTKKIDSMANVLKNFKSIDTNKAKLTIEIARSLLDVDPDKAKAYTDEAYALCKKLDYKVGIVTCLSTFAYVGFYKGDVKYAEKNFKESVAYCRKFNITKKLGNELANLALVHFYSAEYDTCIKEITEAIKVTIETKEDKYLSDYYNTLGLAWQSKGKYDETMKAFLKALKISESRKDSAGLVRCYSQLGGLSTKLKKPDEAEQYYKMAYEIHKRRNEKDGLVITGSNIGTLYMDRGDPDKALPYFEEALKLAKELQQPQLIGSLLEDIGNVYRDKAQYDKALRYFNECLEIKEKVGNKPPIAIARFNLAVLYERTNNFKKAFDNYEQSLKISSEIGLLDMKGQSELALSTLAEQTGDERRAYRHLKAYLATHDTLYDQERTKQITEMGAKYESEKKEQQIALLNKDNALKASEAGQREAELKQQRVVIAATLLGGVIVFICLIFAIRSYRQKQKANLQLQEKNVLIEQQKNEVTQQKHLVEEKQKEIIDSINYAKRIQSTLLAHTDFLNDNIPNNFVLFKPKDIVSGDFYWATKHGNLFFLAVCDSTGHGVPGAFMSLLNIGFLSEAINEKNITRPHEVLNYVRERLIMGISKEGQKDGFDGILLCIDQTSKKMTYAAAHNAPIVIRNGEIIELEKDKMPVGKGERTESFRTFDVTLEKQDSLYLYTDGYADQFGGPKGKKFLYKRLNELLKSLNPDELSKRGDKLNAKFEEWRGGLEQVDDVLVIGIKI